jgi:gliding motility-associated-like protein
MKKILFFLSMIITGTVFSQAPLIQDINKDHGAMGEIVTLRGNSFGSDKTQLDVFFGAAKGSVLTATDHIVEVTIPQGATHDYISLLRKDLKLTGYSSPQFFISFSGTTDPVSPSDFSAQTDISTKTGPTTSNLYDLCMCDFNKDGKSDIVTAHSSLNYISLLKNNSTIGSFSFTRTDLNLSAKTIHINCGDLDNDGNPDLIATEDGSTGRFFYVKGNGDGTFSSLQNIPFNSLIRHVQIADLDADGKPEVILSNKSANEVIILPNTSAGSISFGAAIHITIAPINASDGTDALQVEDIDNDNMPDIIVSPTQSANVYVLRNKSTFNNFQFDTPITLTVPGAVTGIKVGDLDGDGKTEIAVTKFSGTLLSILKNTSSPGNISFQSAIDVTVALSGSWGLDFGDLNGDGKTDIVVPHTTASATSPVKSNLTILENKGGLVFQKSTIVKNDISRYVKIGDLDGDGKPDIAGVSVDIFVAGIGNVVSSNVFLIRNLRCMQPKANPPGPINVCNTDPVQLDATLGGGVTYQWQQDNIDLPGENSNVLSLSSGVDADFKIVASSVGCPDLASNIVHVTIASSVLITSNPIVITPDPACAGPNSSVTLQGSVSAGVVNNYRWTGPTFGPVTSATGSAVVGGTGVGLTLDNSGYYTLEYLGSGNCIIKSETVLVNVINVPDFSINLSTGNIICPGQSTTLSVFPSPSGYDYKWLLRNPDTSTTPVGTDNTAFSPGVGGNYFATVTAHGTSCSVNLTEVNIIQKATINTSFTAQPIVCTNQNVTFVNNTSSPETLKYAWDFGDGGTSTDTAPTHAYTTVSPGVTVKLIASYTNGACPDQDSKIIEVKSSPVIQIVSATGETIFCEGGTLELGVTGSTFSDYHWSTGETSPTIDATDAQEYQVTVTTSVGCSLAAGITLSYFLPASVLLTATPETINPGESSQLNVDGLATPQWSPAETLSDAGILNPIASPPTTTDYTVKGIDANGCNRAEVITVKIASKAIVSLLNPHNAFTPNADAVDGIWTVDNILNFPSCGITIYDEKGVKVYEAKPYNNDWNGTFNGTALPDGVYYYIIRCDGEENKPRSGSITLLR